MSDPIYLSVTNDHNNLSAFTVIVNNPSIIGRELKNTLTWMTIAGMHLILFALSGLQILIQLELIQVTFNMMLQLPLSHTILFWPKFYYSLFKYKEVRRSIWRIVTNPLVVYYRRPVSPYNKITFFNASCCCHSLYQAKGAYSCLHQKNDNDI